MRTSALLLAFAGVAMGLVHIRSEQARSVAAALTHESEWARLRRDLWEVQTQIARLKAPGDLHARLKTMQVSLTQPYITLPLPSGASVPPTKASKGRKPAKPRVSVPIVD